MVLVSRARLLLPARLLVNDELSSALGNHDLVLLTTLSSHLHNLPRPRGSRPTCPAAPSGMRHHNLPGEGAALLLTVLSGSCHHNLLLPPAGVAAAAASRRHRRRTLLDHDRRCRGPLRPVGQNCIGPRLSRQRGAYLPSLGTQHGLLPWRRSSRGRSSSHQLGPVPSRPCDGGCS